MVSLYGYVSPRQLKYLFVIAIVFLSLKNAIEMINPGGEWRGGRHEGMEEVGSDHGDDTKEVTEETVTDHGQRRRTEGWQSSYGIGGCG